MLKLIREPGDQVLVPLRRGEDRDKKFEQVIRWYPELQAEMTAKGTIVLMAPGGLESGKDSGRVFGQLFVWNEETGKGKVFDSSTVFTLPNGAKRSPDASWIPNAVWDSLSKEERQKMSRVCPSFVIEVRSPSDRLSRLQKKCREWVEQGVELAWLIDPYSRNVYSYTKAGDEVVEAQAENGAAHINGTGPVEGFRMDLTGLWEDR